MNLTSSINWAVVLSAAGVLQGFFLVFLILALGNQKNTSGKLFLSGFILSLSLFIMFPILEEVASSRIPKIACIIDPLIFLIGPCLYFYFESLHRQPSIKEFFPHTLVFFVYAGWLYIFLTWFYEPVDTSTFTLHPQFFIIGGLKFGHLIYYLIKGRNSLHRLKEMGESTYSDFELVNTAWARQLLYGMVIITYSAVLLYFFAVWNASYSKEVDYFVISMFTPFIYFASYKGITNSLVVREYAGQGEQSESARQDDKPQNPRLSDKLRGQIESGINCAIERDEIYKNPALTLEELAECCGCSVHQMSYYLNNVIGQSFYDFINGHRVEAVKQELINPQNGHLNILAIGMDAGFNSKTAFNTIFKKTTGYTPSRYKKEHLKG